ncbi:sodium-coupled monocarboxylate transporter 1-like isoform X2 [Ostrea edulis]|uniref:sodium-coupled monocarboxylate transporter 1-like isoform X2 n=1 Tax=Ostrea edulis TaxID=37623 RepID=UPI0024AFAB77|nr:sodium-coupled monocarboxylate transporter 1-like isoform X2 [Ostrea edulis]
MVRNYQYIFEQKDDVTFNAVDYVVFGATLLISASIGLYYAIKDRKKTDEKEFLLAGRSMQTFPVALSLLSSFISAITLLGTPAEVYSNNTMYWWISIGFIISAAATAHIFVPVFYRLEITSVFQYIELRFGHVCRVLGSLIYLLWMLLYMSVVLYGPSLALNAVTNLSLWGSVIAVGLVCIFYTTLGGMKAVVWTDSFQMLIMFAGMLALLISGSMKLGGLDVAWDIANKNQRIMFFEFNPDPSVRHTTWNVIVGGGFFWMAIYGINQAQVQRAISVPSVRHAKIALWLNFPGMFLILSLVCSVGVVMYAFYSECDPVSLKIISKTDQGGNVGLVTALAFVAWIGLGTSLNNVVITPKSPVTTAGCNMTAINALNRVTTTIASTTAAVMESTTPTVPAPPKDYFLLYRMSYIWYTGLAVITVVIIGSIVSLITGGHKKMSELDPRVICPFFDVFMPFLPESFRRKMRCGVRHGDENFIAKFMKSQEQKLQHDGIDNKALDMSDISLSEKKEIKNGYTHNDLSTKL